LQLNQLSTSADAPQTQALGKWRRIVLVLLGITMILMPVGQLYLALKPWLAMADFLPMEMILTQLKSAAYIGNSGIIAGLLMLIGGILIFIRHRWGWVMGVASLAFSVFWTLESFGFIAYMLLKSPGSAGQVLAMGIEVLEMTYYAPLIFLMLQIAGLACLLTKTMRSYFRLGKSHIWATLGVLLLLLIDLHLSLLVIYLQNQI
jgi:hypothetical protein